jgi:hypothetical protein
MYTLLWRTQPACIRPFTKDNPRTDLQIQPHNFAAISDIRTYPNHNIHKHASIDLVYPYSTHIKIIIPSLEIPIHHSSSFTWVPPWFRSSKTSPTHNQHLDLTLYQIFITCSHFCTPLGLMIFSLYRFRPCSIPWSKTITNQYHQPRN